jgi:hypothetical protein
MLIKIQCSCGAKYSFDATPEMAARPMAFVCQACGLDNSALVNSIVREQFGLPASPPPASLPVGRILAETPASAAPPVPVARAATATPAVRVRADGGSSAAAPAPAPATQLCLKHPGQVMTAQCVVCKKPICPKCMEQLGLVCSAYCKGKAEDLGINVLSSAAQKAVVAAKEWQKARRAALAVVLLVMVLLGGWIWYEFLGSRPRVVFSIRLPSDEQSGFCRLISPDQVLFLHGAELKRYDLTTKKELWSVALVDAQQMARSAAEQFAKIKLERERRKARRGPQPVAADDDEGFADGSGAPSRDAAEEIADLAVRIERDVLAHLRFELQGENLWVVSRDKVVRHNGQNGQVAQEVPIEGRLTEFNPSETSLVLISRKENGAHVLLRIDKATGRVETAEVASEPAAPRPIALTSTRAVAAGPGGSKPVAGRSNVASAATASARAAAAAEDAEAVTEEPLFIDASRIEWVGAGRNVVRLSVKLAKKNWVTYRAMREKSGPSELEKGVSAANSAAAINEVLNEWQEEKTGGQRWEDESIYRVTLERFLGDRVPEWTGEVTGPPRLFPTPTVDVLVAGKTVTVFDKSSKRLWESKLAYPVSSEPSFGSDGFLESATGARPPCLEHGNLLFLFDPAMLTAFDLASGNVRWRLPSVGIRHVQAGDGGALYVMSTSAGVDRLKYSQQIDVSRKTVPVLMKVDAASGKVLWRVSEQGDQCHLTSKFLYLVEKDMGDDSFKTAGLGVPEHTRISRLNPKDGGVMWEYYEYKYPLAVDFQANTFLVLFRNELRVLKFLSL